MKKTLIAAALLELLYLILSFNLAEHYGQWSYCGEIMRCGLRIVSILLLLAIYRCYFYQNDTRIPTKKQYTPAFISLVLLFLLFAVVYSNVDTESLSWQSLFAFSGLLAGFREELFYRGMLQQSLQSQYHYRTALLISCLLFTLAHIQFIYYQQHFAILLITLAGLIFGSIFIYTGSVFTVGAIHGLYDALLSIKLITFKLSNTTALMVLALITLLFLFMIYQDLSRSKPSNNTF